MARKTWKEARRKFSAEAETRIQGEKEEIVLEGTPREIRQHLSDLNQTNMGKLLEVSQEAVSQLERRHDQRSAALHGSSHRSGGGSSCTRSSRTRASGSRSSRISAGK